MEILIGALVLAATALMLVVARKSRRYEGASAERRSLPKTSKDDVLLL
jgi:hypothetical protein